MLYALPNPDATLDDNLIGFTILMCLLCVGLLIAMILKARGR